MHKRLALVECQGLLIYLTTVAIGLGDQKVTCFKFLPHFDRNPSLVAGLTDDPVDPDRKEAMLRVVIYRGFACVIIITYNCG